VWLKNNHILFNPNGSSSIIAGPCAQCSTSAGTTTHFAVPLTLQYH